MCRPASMVITKDRVFCSRKSDSHEDIVDEFDLTEMVAGQCCIVHVEITPGDGDLAKPIGGWNYQLDQDILPEWYEKNPDKYEKRVRDAVCREGHAYFVADLTGTGATPAGLVEALVVSREPVFEPKRVLHISAVYVLRPHRRRGIGRAPRATRRRG